MTVTLITHPLAIDASKFLQGLGPARLNSFSEAFERSAEDGDASAALCVSIIAALREERFVSELDVLALAWAIRDMAATCVELQRVPEDLDCGQPTFLEQAVQELLDTEDDTGCTEDLTVVSKEAVEKVRSLLEGEG